MWWRIPDVPEVGAVLGRAKATCSVGALRATAERLGLESGEHGATLHGWDAPYPAHAALALKLKMKFFGPAESSL